MTAAPAGAVLRAALTCDDRKRTSGRRTAPPLRKRPKMFVHAKGTKMEKSRSLWLRDFETVKKVVIPSQCAHWRGNLPDNCNIFGS